jgi:hypothetical protein
MLTTKFSEKKTIYVAHVKRPKKNSMNSHVGAPSKRREQGVEQRSQIP